MTYPEVCEDCGHRFDDVRPGAEFDEHTACPKCGGVCRNDWSPEARPSVPLVFKGDGFYCSRPHVEVSPPRDGNPREVNLTPGHRSC